MSNVAYDPMAPKHDSDPGYIIGWRHKKRFEAGKLDGEMTYGEAVRRAEELCREEPDKTFWAEKKLAT